MSDTSRLPPLKALRALEAVHRTGSVTAAASLLNVSHSAVSHQMKALEAWARHPLFTRQGRTIGLTLAGKSLAGVTHEAFDTIRHEVDRIPMRAMRSIGISSLPLVATKWLMPRLKAFRLNYPEINIHLSMAQNDRPTTPLPDIEILFSKKSQLLPDDISLFEGTAVPVSTPSLLEIFKGNIKLLLETGPLIHDEDLRMWPLWFKSNIEYERMKIEPSGLVVEGSALLRSAALQGHGIALCRSAFLKDDFKTGNLIALSEHKIDDDWCYFIRCEVTKRMGAGVLEIINWLTHESNL
ncbi:MAG: LysR family transcriptional regulator [Proteobacteria bacterium]|jgi:LysR family glycine cleavage system transcriptional activator|nr:LysR family transcriptional regulator [Pseudomonadota bacterium]